MRWRRERRAEVPISRDGPATVYLGRSGAWLSVDHARSADEGGLASDGSRQVGDSPADLMARSGPGPVDDRGRAYLRGLSGRHVTPYPGPR